MTLEVVAYYAPRMTEERERRINAALKRCDVLHGVRSELVLDGVPIYHSDVAWTSNEDSTETELFIYVGEDMERAVRLASELRTCGMVASIQREDDA